MIRPTRSGPGPRQRPVPLAQPAPVELREDGRAVLRELAERVDRVDRLDHELVAAARDVEVDAHQEAHLDPVLQLERRLGLRERPLELAARALEEDRADRRLDGAALGLARLLDQLEVDVRPVLVAVVAGDLADDPERLGEGAQQRALDAGVELAHGERRGRARARRVRGRRRHVPLRLRDDAIEERRTIGHARARVSDSSVGSAARLRQRRPALLPVESARRRGQREAVVDQELDHLPRVFRRTEPHLGQAVEAPARQRAHHRHQTRVVGKGDAQLVAALVHVDLPARHRVARPFRGVSLEAAEDRSPRGRFRARRRCD